MRSASPTASLSASAASSRATYARNLKYNKNRIFAFVMALGEVTEEKYAAAAGAISYGFPTIADTDIPQILPTGICTYEHVVSNVPIDHIVEKCLEVRGCKIKVAKVPIPVAYGAAFEGERIRKEQTYVEFGGNRTPGFEYVTTLELTEVEDGKIDGHRPGDRRRAPKSAARCRSASGWKWPAARCSPTSSRSSSARSIT